MIMNCAGCNGYDAEGEAKRRGFDGCREGAE
jgi:hypothetical protein